jgi:GAF domain-containing protein
MAVWPDKMPLLTLGADMARPSRTGGKKSKANARNARGAKGRKTTKAKPRIAPVATRVKRRSVSGPSKDLKDAREQQAATAEILKVIASSPSNVQPVFDAIAASANRLVGGYSTAVMRYDGDAIHLTAITRTDRVGDEPLKAFFPRSLDNDGDFQALRNGRIVQIPDTETHPQTWRREMARKRGFRSQLLVPLMNNGAAVGHISVTRAHTGSFADHHVDLLQTFADQAVIAIENVRLFDEVQAKTRDLTESLQQQTATADVLKVISRSAFDLKTVLDALLTSACHLCEADIGTIRYKDDGDFRLAATFGCPPEWIDQFSKYSTKADRSSVFGRTIVDGHTVHIPDVLADPDFKRPEAQKLMGFRAALGVPLSRDGQAFGVINLFRFAVGSFEDKQIELVQTFADQAVIAIENVRLFDEVQARTRDITEALTYQTGSANILKVIASSPTDVGPVLKAIVETACELCEAYDAVLVLKDGQDLRFSAHHGPIPMTLVKWPINRNWTAGRAFVDQRPVHVHDLQSSEGDEFPDGREMSRLMGHRTILSVPLLSEGESIGTIVLRRTEVHPFNDKQTNLLQTFADQAVIAIGNVRLFEEVRARTRDLTESLQQQTATADVLKVISTSSGELEPVFQAMLENAVRLCDAKFAMLMLYEKETNEFRGVGKWNLPPAYSEFFGKRAILADPKIPLGRVAITKRPVQVADVLVDQSYIERFPGVVAVAELGGARTLLQVPMLKDNELVGTIGIYRQEVVPFTDKQIALVQNFGAQAVTAIENARLLNELRQRTDDLTESLNDLRTAQDRLVQTEKLASLGQLTAGIAHEIKNPLNFVNNFSALSAELTDELNEVLKPVAMDGKVRGEVDELTGLLKDNLEKVVQHGKRADSIVKNMLLHSREGSREHQPADINALLDESLNLAYHGARAEKGEFNITVQRDFDTDAGTIELFPQEITRAFLNLITNGIYAATRRKTEDKEPGFRPTLWATTKNLGTTVEIRIRDNGTGIPAEVQEKMFNPFFTTKPAGEGTGLGLSMTHDIVVKQHGGIIDVVTEPGQFTEFTIVLPRKSNLAGRDRGKA